MAGGQYHGYHLGRGNGSSRTSCGSGVPNSDADVFDTGIGIETVVTFVPDVADDVTENVTVYASA